MRFLLLSLALAANPMGATPEAPAPAAPAPATPAPAPAAPSGAIPVPPGAPTLGPADARVQVVVFSDFQCPFCRRFSATVHQIAEEHPKDVQIVFLDYPIDPACNPGVENAIHDRACAAARAGRCATRQGKFWPMHDQLFEHQADLDDAAILDAAKKARLDVPAFRACLADPTVNEEIRAEGALGKQLGVNGTPTSFVNGKALPGAQPIEAFRAAIDASH